MAKPIHADGGKFVVKFGDGADPEVFASKCMINTNRGISFTTEVSTSNLPDCDDPDAPDILIKRVISKDFEITGEGTYDGASEEFFFDLWNTGAPINVVVERVAESGVAGVSYAGPVIMTQFDITAPHKELSTASMTFTGAGDLVRTTIAAA